MYVYEIPLFSFSKDTWHGSGLNSKKAKTFSADCKNSAQSVKWIDLNRACEILAEKDCCLTKKKNFQNSSTLNGKY